MELEGPNFAARRAELRREAREAATREAASKGSAQRQGQRGQGGGAPPAGGGYNVYFEDGDHELPLPLDAPIELLAQDEKEDTQRAARARNAGLRLGRRRRGN